MHAGTDDQVSSPNRKRARPLDDNADPPPSAGAGLEHNFIQDADGGESGADDDDDEGVSKPSDKKAGRRKIKIEFIQDKSRRHITFSKRKAGIMKKAYELSTLTGTQVLLLVVSETGLVYTFTTAKLQPLVTQPEGKNLIQACLNAPHGSLPNNMPIGAPLGRPSNQIPPPPPSSTNGSTTSGSTVQSPASVIGPGGVPMRSNTVGGISIGGTGPQSGVHTEDDDSHGSGLHPGQHHPHHRDDRGDDDERNANRRRPSVVGGAPVPGQGAVPPKPTARSPTSPHTTNMVPQQQAQVSAVTAAQQQQQQQQQAQQQAVPNSPGGNYTAAPTGYGQPGAGAPGRADMYTPVMHSSPNYPYTWPAGVAPSYPRN